MDWLYLVICLEIFLFLLLAASILYLYYFYKKNINNLQYAFQILIDKGYLLTSDYSFYDSLGFWGFGFKVSILNMILKGRCFKIKEGRHINPHAKKYLIDTTHSDFEWVVSFYKIFKIQILIAVLFLACIFLSKWMGV